MLLQVHVDFCKSTFKNKLFYYRGIFFSKISISKMRAKMNFRIKTKNSAIDPEIWPPRKIDLTLVWSHEAIPTAWVLK